MYARTLGIVLGFTVSVTMAWFWPVSLAPSKPTSEAVSNDGLDSLLAEFEAAIAEYKNPSAAPTDENAAAVVARPIPLQKDAAPIGSLKGREYTITIYSTTNGPRFTIAAADGRVLGEMLSFDEVRAQHPTIYETYKSTFAGTGGSFDASVGHVVDAR